MVLICEARKEEQENFFWIKRCICTESGVYGSQSIYILQRL